MITKGHVGWSQYAKGVDAPHNVSHQGDLVGADIYGKHYEAVRRGHIWAGSTAEAGVAPGTAIGTTAPFVLHNPQGSGVILSILQASMGYVSGTLGAGQVVWIAIQNVQLATPSGTAIVPRNCYIGGVRADASGARPLTTATIASPVILRPVFQLDASLATTASAGTKPMVDYVDGAILVFEGGTVGLQGIAAAGTTPLVIFGCIWAEVPIV